MKLHIILALAKTRKWPIALHGQAREAVSATCSTRTIWRSTNLLRPAMHLIFRIDRRGRLLLSIRDSTGVKRIYNLITIKPAE